MLQIYQIILIWKNFKESYLKIGTKKRPHSRSHHHIKNPPTQPQNGHTTENKALPGRFSPICKPNVKQSPEDPQKSPSNVKQM
jgi:hypothetical protein